MAMNEFNRKMPLLVWSFASMTHLIFLLIAIFFLNPETYNLEFNLSDGSNKEIFLGIVGLSIISIIASLFFHNKTKNINSDCEESVVYFVNSVAFAFALNGNGICGLVALDFPLEYYYLFVLISLALHFYNFSLLKKWKHK